MAEAFADLTRGVRPGAHSCGIHPNGGCRGSDRISKMRCRRFAGDDVGTVDLQKSAVHSRYHRNAEIAGFDDRQSESLIRGVQHDDIRSLQEGLIIEILHEAGEADMIRNTGIRCKPTQLVSIGPPSPHDGEFDGVALAAQERHRLDHRLRTLVDEVTVGQNSRRSVGVPLDAIPVPRVIPSVANDDRPRSGGELTCLVMSLL